MAAPFGVGGQWPLVSELIELASAMGCQLHELENAIQGLSDGSPNVRFLYNPETEGFVSLNGYADDERIPRSELENWERRLGIQIPKSDQWN